MNFQKRLILLTLPLLALGSSLAGCSKSAAADPSGDATADTPVSVQAAPITVGLMKVTVPIDGTLVPSQGKMAQVAPLVSGKIQQILVHQGEHVSQGQPIAILDGSLLAAQAEQAQAAAQQAQHLAAQSQIESSVSAKQIQAQVAIAQDALTQAKLDAQLKVENARASKTAADNELAKLKQGARPQELQSAAAKTQQAKAAMVQAQQNEARTKDLYSHGLVSKKDVQDATAAFAIAKSGFEQAQADESLLKAGARPQDLATAESAANAADRAYNIALTSAKLEIAQAEKQYQQALADQASIAGKKEAGQAGQANAVAMAKAAGAAQVTLNNAVIRAPFSGVVMQIMKNPGDLVDPTTPIATISDPSSVDFVGQAPTASLTEAKVGDPITVAPLDSTGQPLVGTVVAVGPVDPASGQEQIRGTVHLTTQENLAGLGAHALVTTGTHSHALLCPTIALLDTEKGTAIFIIGPDGKAESQPVTTGSTMDGKVEILKGAKAGDQVITVGQDQIDAGQKVTAAPPDGSPSPDATTTSGN